jgi:hypothetical protein
LHGSYLQNKNVDCAKLLKDFITSAGDVNQTELNPAIVNDPILQQQCERNGYMTIQVGDELRTVYCQSGDVGKGFGCPNCGMEFCLSHMLKHLGGKLIDENSIKIEGPVAYGSANPPIYDQMPGTDTQGVNVRAQYAQNDEDKDNPISDLLQRRADGMNIRKMMMGVKSPESSTLLQKSADNDKGGEHELGSQELVSLPLEQRIQAEVWSYLDEYKSAVSQADISCELETRGKDAQWQEKTEEYAHANDGWLDLYLDDMVRAGLLRRCPGCGGYIPPLNYTPPKPSE